MKPKFKIEFDPNYYVLNEDDYTAIVEDSFFCDDLGYDSDDLDKVLALKIGESIWLDHGYQTITRIQ